MLKSGLFSIELSHNLPHFIVRFEADRECKLRQITVCDAWFCTLEALK